MTDITVVAADERTTATDLVVDVVRWAALAEVSLRTEGADGELTLTFIDDVDIAELNADYMGKTGPTDVLSFPLDDDDAPSLPGVPTLLGDIVISASMADRQFVEHAGTYDDELALLVVHGVLHILGHDHEEPDEAAVMRAREMALLEEHHWGGNAPPAFRQTHD